ncbi:hypothetical protein CMO88_04090 [Candidatus Woesearchaeota archaeon]|nr:hypothetical protein [Candidatus Woesearchaeota archaeon]|tara:strand:- start:22077 stop:23282 length:1206 start_codon:yes stop_codon:yes gene_type:complete
MKRGGKFILFLVVISVLFALSTIFVNGKLVCDITSAGCADLELFRLNSDTNAHGELAGLENYNWEICCSFTEGEASVLDNSCAAPDVQVTALSSATDGHAEVPGETTYDQFVCLSADPGTVTCRTIEAGSCAGDEECVFSQSTRTNAHAGDCGESSGVQYGNITCCQYFDEACGAEGQACCGGTFCFDPLSCNADTVLCEDVGGSPSCPGLPAGSGKISGVITNITGDNVENARVTVVGKGFDLTDASGFYEIEFADPDDGSPYDVTITHADYETGLAFGLVIHNDECPQKNFIIYKPAEGCNNDCTMSDGLCHADCNNKGACSYISPATASACDSKVPGIIDYGDEQILCCTGAAFTPVQANVGITCGENVISIEKPVLFKGKLVNMVLTVFDAVGCEVS